MAAISWTTSFWDLSSWVKKHRSYLIQISLKIVPKGPINYQVSTGSYNNLAPNMPLFEQMMAYTLLAYTLGLDDLNPHAVS